jgi:hypothetical protein
MKATTTIIFALLGGSSVAAAKTTTGSLRKGSSTRLLTTDLFSAMTNDNTASNVAGLLSTNVVGVGDETGNDIFGSQEELEKSAESLIDALGYHVGESTSSDESIKEFKVMFENIISNNCEDNTGCTYDPEQMKALLGFIINQLCYLILHDDTASSKSNEIIQKVLSSLTIYSDGTDHGAYLEDLVAEIGKVCTSQIDEGDEVKSSLVVSKLESETYSDAKILPPASGLAFVISTLFVVLFV